MVAAVLIVFTCFCLFALYAVMSGELIRSRQKGQVLDYVIQKKAALMRSRQLEKARSARAEEAEALTRIRFRIPEDEKLASDLRFFYNTAAQSPKVLSNVIRMYLIQERDKRRREEKATHDA